MKNLNRDTLKWLDSNPPLEALMDRFPELWETTARELSTSATSGNTTLVNDFAIKARNSASTWRNRIAKSHNNPSVIEAALPALIKSRMLVLTLDRGLLANATKKVSGKVRFNLFNGLIIQKLLFEKELIRKPASLPWVRFWWPFLWQRKLLMPLVQDKGIYCFYSKQLISCLCKLIGSDLCLEIGAGDGTLARFLSERGVNIKATDDYTWKHSITYPAHVENLGAKQALEKYRPKTVICSWPPPANRFEKHIFQTPSVELYIVIGSKYKFISGNWDAYSTQDKFDWYIDKKLSAKVIPPFTGNAVLVFRRKTASA